MAKTVGVYINANDMKKSNSCSDLDARLVNILIERENILEIRNDFEF